MSDVPPDVETVLGQLFEEARTGFEADEIEAGRSAIDSADSVISNKLPEGDLRGQLRHGCTRVEELLDDGETAAAAEYVAAMERRIEDLE